MAKRIKKARTYRCKWCGKEYKAKAGRIPKHKTHPALTSRSDGYCSGSEVLVKFLKPQPVDTHPQALAKKSPRKSVKRKARAR